MLRSFYIAGTGMLTQRQKMDTVINNLTNMDTTGYKTDMVVTRSFEDLLLHRLNDDPAILGARKKTNIASLSTGRPPRTGGQNTGIYYDEAVIDFTPGSMDTTGRLSDFAIQGDGFFTIQTPDGVRYTRSGNFQVDLNGNLLTQDGNYVVGTDGGMVNVGTGDFAVDSHGNIQVDGNNVGQLRIVQFPDTTVLRKQGGSLFYPYDGTQPNVMATPNVQQGMLETSNVDLGAEMADMLMTNRVYESSQRMLRMIDETLEKTVNTVAQF